MTSLCIPHGQSYRCVYIQSNMKNIFPEKLYTPNEVIKNCYKTEKKILMKNYNYINLILYVCEFCGAFLPRTFTIQQQRKKQRC